MLDINASDIEIYYNERVLAQLRLACERIGSLSVEHAFWILIPTNQSKEAEWISAVGQEGGLSATIRLPLMVVYSPSPENIEKLRRSIAECDWILHVHNHPQHPYPGFTVSANPSSNDLAFASSWKDKLSGVGGKLRFFVIQGEHVGQYGDITAEKPSPHWLQTSDESWGPTVIRKPKQRPIARRHIRPQPPSFWQQSGDE